MKVIYCFVCILFLSSNLDASADIFLYENTNYTHHTIYTHNTNCDFITSSEILGENKAIPFPRTNFLPNNSPSNTFTAKVCDGSAPYKVAFTYLGGFAFIRYLPSKDKECVEYQIVYEEDVDWTLTVRDVNGYQNESMIFDSGKLSPPTSLQIKDYTLQPENCHGDGNGSIQIEVKGGNKACGNYTYHWVGPNGLETSVVGSTKGSSMTDLGSGFYDVIVTDCSGKTTIQDIYLSRSNSIGRSRGGVCKTLHNETQNLLLFPNPFGHNSEITFRLAETSIAWLAIYSVEGRHLVALLEGVEIEGGVLQRLDFAVEQLQSGVYILSLRTESGMRYHQKMIVR